MGKGLDYKSRSKLMSASVTQKLTAKVFCVTVGLS